MLKEISQLDYKIDNVQDRINCIKKITECKTIDGIECCSEEFFFPYDVSLNQGDGLLSDTEYCKSLEIMGSYLLNSPDEKEYDKKNKTKIKVYHTKQLFDRQLKDEEIAKSLLPNSNFEDVDFFSVLKVQKNYKKDTNFKITENEMMKTDIVKDYFCSLKNLKDKNKSLIACKNNKEILLQKSRLRKLIGFTKEDIKIIYQQIKKPIRFKNTLRDNGSPDWDYLDMFDYNVVKELLKIDKSKLNVSDDLYNILIDLELLLEKVKLTKKQQDILEMYRTGVSVKDIAVYLDVTSANISKSIKSIINHIIKEYYRIYEDWYYLNISRGKYQRCERCGEVKLISRFGVRNGKRDGKCKDCL